MAIQTVSDFVKAGKKEELDLNCSETILYGSNDAYNLLLDDNDLTIAAGFGKGMAIESTCGALTGAIMVLSLLNVDSTAHKSKIYDIVEEFLKDYKTQMGHINCAPLKENYRTEKEGCRKVILKAAELLDKYVDKYPGNGN